jgi:hypothetical protein
MAKAPHVLGIFKDRAQLNNAVSELRDRGFANSGVSVLLPQNLQSKQMSTGPEPSEEKTKAADGAKVGAGSGAVVGGALGWLAGMSAIVIPGVGPFLAVGPVVAMLMGVGTGGAVGGFLGTLIGVGIPEDEARVYEGRMIKGDSLLIVQCQGADQVQEARRVMEHSGAENISSTASVETRDASAA